MDKIKKEKSMQEKIPEIFKIEKKGEKTKTKKLNPKEEIESVNKKEVIKTWQKLVGWVIIGFKQTLKKLGVEEFDEEYKVFYRVWLSKDGTKIGIMDFYRFLKEGVNYEGRILTLACKRVYITFSIYDGRLNEQFIDNVKTNKRGERMNESDGIIDELRTNSILYPYEDLPECPKN